MKEIKQRRIDKMFIDIAVVVSDQSKCLKLHVGSVITKDGYIISMGYNGSAAGFTNCCDQFKDSMNGHSDWADNFEIHAEMNAILFAARTGISTQNTTLYCTHIPCHNCLKHIIQAGISRVVWLNDWASVKYTQETNNLINNAGLVIERFETNENDQHKMENTEL